MKDKREQVKIYWKSSDWDADPKQKAVRIEKEESQSVIQKFLAMLCVKGIPGAGTSL